VKNSLKSSQNTKQKDSILTSKPGVTAHTCNPSYIEGIGRKITLLGLPGQNERPYLKTNLKQKWLEPLFKW
jgi:hypothetical protein